MNSYISFLLTIDIYSSFLAQILLLHLSHDLTSSSLAFSQSSSFQRYRSICRIFKVLASLSFLFFFCSFSSHFFSSSSSSSSFFSFFFYFCNFSSPYFDLHCFPHFYGYLIIFTSPILQSISGLWCASHGISKITFHFCPPITSISILSQYH